MGMSVVNFLYNINKSTRRVRIISTVLGKKTQKHFLGKQNLFSNEGAILKLVFSRTIIVYFFCELEPYGTEWYVLAFVEVTHLP